MLTFENLGNLVPAEPIVDECTNRVEATPSSARVPPAQVDSGLDPARGSKLALAAIGVGTLLVATVVWLLID